MCISDRFYVVARGRENSYIRSVVTRIAGAALMYAFVVNVLTPEALSSTRYYYADMLLVLLAYIICVFAIFDKIIKKGGKVKRLYMTAVGICIIALNVIQMFIRDRYNVLYLCINIIRYTR